MELRGRAWQVTQSVLLLAVCIIAYILLILLFSDAESYHLDSLLHPEKGTLSPAVAVGLLAALLTGATPALVTRCVEQSLWTTLAPKADSGLSSTDLTVGETRRLAQWSTSPLQRIMYLFGGFHAGSTDRRSWLLRFAGPLLVATATVGPVLLVGISQGQDFTTSTYTAAREADPWLSYLDVGNRRYRGGNSFDNPHFGASLAAMGNLTPPAAPVCNGTSSSGSYSCSASTRSVSIHAECRGISRENPDGAGLIRGGLSSDTAEFCTGSGTPRELCVELMSGSPAIYAAFASGPPPCDAGTLSNGCPSSGQDGLWARIYGVWVNSVEFGDSNSEHRINIVDCVLTYGNVTVRQNGTSPPVLDRSSFSRATSSRRSQFGYTDISGSVGSLNRIYAELGNSPYDFSAAAVGTGSNTAYRQPMAYMLLGEDAIHGAERVARQIEDNFDMATLHAFARMPGSSEITYTIRRSEARVYVYDARVLLILLVPCVATVLGCWGRWKVAGEDVVVGYDPVGIARLGPVTGLYSGALPADREARDEEDSLRVWRWQRIGPYQNGFTATATGFAVGSLGVDNLGGAHAGSQTGA
ncbi:hypothetical protein ACJ41O_011615 [Fusarium nematophilum]